MSISSLGATFLAEDTHIPSNRRCVIKKLQPQHHNLQIYQLIKDRFATESKILAELGDNNQQIPRIYNYFEFDGEFYLVQEWISGVTLAEKFKQEGIFSDSLVEEILIGILPVLDYLHSQNIVHRDLKPDHLILRSEDNQPVLIDFGTVKETMGTIVTASGKIASSILIGTREFMSIEQNAGRPIFSSDLFSLGLTAIYLLTGKLSTELPSDPATGQIIWRESALSVSSSLAEVLEKAIKFHYRDRYPTAMEMLVALQTKPSPKLQIYLFPQLATQLKPSLPEWTKFILATIFIGGLSFVGLVLLRQVYTQKPLLPDSTNESASTENFPISQTLENNASRNYTHLENLLYSGKLQEADRETTKILRQLASKNAQPRPQDIDNIPCSDLITINQLWQKHSNNNFGFSTQKQIWQGNGGNTKLFRSQVGWHVNGKALDYHNHNFSPSAPKGHLPLVRSLNHNFLFPRISSCGL
ncbi:MAG: serine/threonine-protein kinase [Oscillatoria sp. PMC 1076.18]|nr:serine/threonine-protein kinase [Oscillatoria sp. PMC 1076.18]